MFKDLSDELKQEIREIGRVRVTRYERWVLNLLTRNTDPRRIIDKLTAKGFSMELAEWIVYSLRETFENAQDVDDEIVDMEEPPLVETLARILFSGAVLTLLVVSAQILQRYNNPLNVLAMPVLMVIALLALGYFGYAVADLWERWRTRNKFK